MAPKKKTETVDEQGFETLPTQEAPQEFEASEWVEPAEGTIIEGELERAFLVEDELGGNPRKPFRAAYSIRDSNGDLWNLGEKAAFAEPIRKLHVGAYIRLEFLKKERLVDVKTKKVGAKSIWRVKFGLRGDGAGENMMDMLKADAKKRQAEGAALPF